MTKETCCEDCSALCDPALNTVQRGGSRHWRTCYTTVSGRQVLPAHTVQVVKIDKPVPNVLREQSRITRDNQRAYWSNAFARVNWCNCSEATLPLSPFLRLSFRLAPHGPRRWPLAHRSSPGFFLPAGFFLPHSM